ncbi:MAG TPA: hypothetical protein VF541_08110 [Longimicrobium sp.]
MNRASEVLEKLRRAEAAACEELERLLAPAGLAVGEIRADGDGWRLRLLPRHAHAHAAPTAAAALAQPPDGESRSRGVEPLARRPGETLMALVSRAGDRLRVSRGDGPGGLRVTPASDVERVRWLGGTLVGDTLLALRHLGEPEDGDRALQELVRQLDLFRAESRRLIRSEDAAPFLEALDRWTPAACPRGRAVLARAEEVARA